MTAGDIRAQAASGDDTGQEPLTGGVAGPLAGQRVEQYARRGAPRVLALVPAHNEEQVLGACLAALAAQTRPADRVVVVADNCTDRTEAVALAAGVEIFLTVDNADKKAGALNQALADALPHLASTDAVLVVDADSVLDPGFLAGALARLSADPGLGGVGGTFRGDIGGGYVGWLQRQEYARYARDVRRLKGKALVLTGTATVFSVDALRSVVTARAAGRLPGPVEVYDTEVKTEDFELSLALMHLGWRILAPAGCTLVTEIMPTWRDLWRQRLRWKRGALENLMQYGLTPVTWTYWVRQALSGLGVIVTVAYLTSLALSLVLAGQVALRPFWLGVTAVFMLERVVTVRDRGWRHMLAAAPLVSEIAFDLWLQAVHAKAYLDTALRRERAW